MTDLMCPMCEHRRPHHWRDHSRGVFWRCPRCELTFLDPSRRLTAAQERAHYETHENDVNDPRYRAFLNRLAGPLLERAERGTGLDYGSGSGPALAAMLREAGYEMRLYDPFFAPDEAALNRRYDVITCSETMEHFFCPGREFARLNRLLKPGGWLGVMTQVLEPNVDFVAWWYAKDPTHVCFYTPTTLAWIEEQWPWRIEYRQNGVALFHQTP